MLASLPVSCQVQSLVQAMMVVVEEQSVATENVTLLSQVSGSGLELSDGEEEVVSRGW